MRSVLSLLVLTFMLSTGYSQRIKSDVKNEFLDIRTIFTSSETLNTQSGMLNLYVIGKVFITEGQKKYSLIFGIRSEITGMVSSQHHATLKLADDVFLSLPFTGKPKSMLANEVLEYEVDVTREQLDLLVKADVTAVRFETTGSNLEDIIKPKNFKSVANICKLLLKY